MKSIKNKKYLKKLFREAIKEGIFTKRNPSNFMVDKKVEKLSKYYLKMYLKRLNKD